MCIICWTTRGAPSSNEQPVLKAASMIGKMLGLSALGRPTLDLSIPGAYAARVVFGDWNLGDYALHNAARSAKLLRDNQEPTAELALDALHELAQLDDHGRGAAMGLAYRFYESEPPL